MALWRYGVMALWRYGVMALWRYDVMTLRSCASAFFAVNVFFFIFVIITL